MFYCGLQDYFNFFQRGFIASRGGREHHARDKSAGYSKHCAPSIKQYNIIGTLELLLFVLLLYVVCTVAKKASLFY